MNIMARTSFKIKLEDSAMVVTHNHQEGIDYYYMQEISEQGQGEIEDLTQEQYEALKLDPSPQQLYSMTRDWQVWYRHSESGVILAIDFYNWYDVSELDVRWQKLPEMFTREEAKQKCEELLAQR